MSTITTVYRQLPAREGLALSNRYRVRRCRSREAMHTFLAKGDNALHWREHTENLPSGIYATQTGVDRETRKAVVTWRKL
jgi:hypothetical protein